jgi:hypothetical protein
VGGEKDAAFSARTRDICGVDNQSAHAPRRVVTSLVEERLARRLKKGVYLIERAVEAVVAVLRTAARY